MSTPGQKKEQKKYIFCCHAFKKKQFMQFQSYFRLNEKIAIHKPTIPKQEKSQTKLYLKF